MVDNGELFVDPEEDEIFFYGVTEKECLAKSVLEHKMQLAPQKINESCSNRNDHASEDIEGKLQSEDSLSAVKKVVDFEKINDLIGLGDNSNLVSVPFERSLENCKIIGDKCPVTNTCQENLKTQTIKGNVESPKKQKTPDEKKLDQRNRLPSVINVHIDHSYSVPMKNVIDKNILKTPKSIVKADKDGGFLKVLSEIALVKAEVDENNLGGIKRSSDPSSAVELTDDDDDDDKENKQSDTDNINITVKPNDLSPAKVYHSLTDPVDELCFVKSLTLKEEKSSNPDIAFEEPTDNLINNELMKESEATEKISNDHFQMEYDNFKGKCYGENIVKENEDLEGICSFEDNFVRKASGMSPAPKIKSPAANVDMESEGKGDICQDVKDVNSESERQKKFVRRNTMRLLEELNELVTFGQAKRESLGTMCNTKLSEEAAKVIQKLKAVGFDDSICSPEQYFDLDKLDSSVFNSEISDILNDTLSKPLSHITSKDVESLLEKITTNSLLVESEIYFDGDFNARKENLDYVSMNENFISESEKSTNDQQKFSDFEAEQFKGICKNESSMPKCEMSVQSEGHKKVTGEGNGLSEKKNLIQESKVPPQAMQIRPKEFRSVEKKNRGLTRIPKLVSTTSKVPITVKEVNQQLGYPTPNKTPFIKAQKSLKFNNIDSTVKTNVNSKMPVIFSSGKGKAATKNDTINTKVKSVNTKSNARNLFPKSESKSSSQFQKFKNTSSLKESSTESHLPKFVPKVLKLPGGNSPVASKYGGNVQRTIQKRP